MRLASTLFRLLILRFDEEANHVELDYPRPIAGVWKGVPDYVDAVTQWPSPDGENGGVLVAPIRLSLIHI